MVRPVSSFLRANLPVFAVLAVMISETAEAKVIIPHVLLSVLKCSPFEPGTVPNLMTAFTVSALLLIPATSLEPPLVICFESVVTLLKAADTFEPF